MSGLINIFFLYQNKSSLYNITGFWRTLSREGTMNFRIAFLITIVFLFRQLQTQELISSEPCSRVLDPFSTDHTTHHFIANDTLHSGKLTISYETFFGMKELQKIQFGSLLKFAKDFGATLRGHFFQWGPFTNIESNTGFVCHMPDLLSSIMVNLKYRYYCIEPVYAHQDYQVDLSGTINFNPYIKIIWAIKNMFGWGNEGPVHGCLAGGIIYAFRPELSIHLGLEKNYLYPMDNWVAISGIWKDTLAYGISYLSLEDEYSGFLGIKVHRYQLEVGMSHHHELGQSYRSGISIWF